MANMKQPPVVASPNRKRAKSVPAAQAKSSCSAEDEQYLLLATPAFSVMQSAHAPVAATAPVPVTASVTRIIAPAQPAPASKEAMVPHTTRLPPALHRRAAFLCKNILPGGKSLNQLMIDGLERLVTELEQKYGVANG